MKQQILNWAIVVATTLLISCNNAATTPSGDATDSTQTTSVGEALPLPALNPQEEVVFENDNVRIVEAETVETDEGVSNTLCMQPKNTSYKAFSIEGTVLAFEGVVGKAVLASEGTGTVRTLWVYDLTTGKELAQIDSFHDSGIQAENDHQFSFYRYDDAYPQVYWNQEKGVWEQRNKVPAELQNADLENAKKEMKENLFHGLTLMAQQKISVDTKTGKVTPLNNYKWSYIE
nr:hypothetical protein [uncultured Capnocytophaga sp.]